MKKTAPYILRREAAFLFKRKRSRAFFVFVYPFIIMGLLWMVFSGRVLDQIPVAVVDPGPGYAAREWVRALRANQYLQVLDFPSLPAAQKALAQGQVYGVVALDADFEADLAKRTGASVRAWINNEYLLVGGNLNKGLNSVAGALNGIYQRRILAGLGVPPAQWDHVAAPLQISETVLYNPPVNYMYFLGLGLLPAVLQLFICLSVCYSLLWDVKTRHARRLRRAFGLHPLVSAGSKVGFYMAAYGGVIGVLLGVMVLFFGLPVQGSVWRVALGVAAFAFLTGSTALFFAALTNNLRLALSICAIYAAPAFAYFGVSFPVPSMPWAARVWAELMPGTHLNRIFVNELLRGSAAGGTWGEIGFMLALGGFFFWWGAKGYARWTSQDAYLGPKL